MSDITITTVPQTQLAALVATLPMDEFSSQIGPMFDQASNLLVQGGGRPTLPIATYQMVDDGMTVVVGYEFDGDTAPAGLELVTLPEDEVASLTHHGAPDGLGQAWQQLHEWVAAHGRRPDAPGRELYVDSEDLDDMDNWTIELQQPVSN